MFRKEGFLNFLQLKILSNQRAIKNFPDAQTENDFELLRKLREFSSRYQFLYFIEGVETLYLINGKTIIAIDADCIIKDQLDYFHEIHHFDTPVTVEKLDSASLSLSPTWPLIDTELGTLVTSKKGFFSRFRNKEPDFYGRVRANLERYHGFSILLKETDVEELWLEIENGLRKQKDTQTMGETVTVSSLEHAFQCFKQAFPDGKGRATWNDVESTTGYSRRTINRALEKLDKS